MSDRTASTQHPNSASKEIGNFSEEGGYKDDKMEEVDKEYRKKFKIANTERTKALGLLDGADSNFEPWKKSREADLDENTEIRERLAGESAQCSAPGKLAELKKENKKLVSVASSIRHSIKERQKEHDDPNKEEKNKQKRDKINRTYDKRLEEAKKVRDERKKELCQKVEEVGEASNERKKELHQRVEEAREASNERKKPHHDAEYIKKIMSLGAIVDKRRGSESIKARMSLDAVVDRE